MAKSDDAALPFMGYLQARKLLQDGQRQQAFDQLHIAVGRYPLRGNMLESMLDNAFDLDDVASELVIRLIEAEVKKR